MHERDTSATNRWLKRAVVLGVGSTALIIGYDIATIGPEQTVQEVIEFFSDGPGGELVKHMDDPFLQVHPAATLVPVDVTSGSLKIVQG